MGINFTSIDYNYLRSYLKDMSYVPGTKVPISASYKITYMLQTLSINEGNIPFDIFEIISEASKMGALLSFGITAEDKIWLLTVDEKGAYKYIFPVETKFTGKSIQEDNSAITYIGKYTIVYGRTDNTLSIYAIDESKNELLMEYYPKEVLDNDFLNQNNISGNCFKDDSKEKLFNDKELEDLRAWVVLNELRV